MAALMKHGLLCSSQELRNSVPCVFMIFCRQYKRDVRPFKHIRLESRAESLAAKGFLRSYKPYTPPPDVGDRFRAICRSVLGPEAADNDGVRFGCPEEKFRLLAACFREFQHGIPNSKLHKVTTLGDVVQFYGTPTNTITPLEGMKQASLPPNLHVQYDYHRFHPETDTKFGGISAFPQSSTLVTGLKYKKKYKGYKAKPSWP
ncbi:large ribosomal subunit protein mL50 [Bacillus rossius redtenbacheri]|uniref:large ribosomal subunit protein mL50 n=1 Tax=Bacillus rossius redtenbacheri TaxID=93214 RepID=UPI002FDD9F1A